MRRSRRLATLIVDFDGRRRTPINQLGSCPTGNSQPLKTYTSTVVLGSQAKSLANAETLYVEKVNVPYVFVVHAFSGNDHYDAV